MLEIKINRNKSCSCSCDGRSERAKWDIYEAVNMLYIIAIAKLGEQMADRVMHDIANKLQNGIIKNAVGTDDSDAKK